MMHTTYAGSFYYRGKSAAAQPARKSPARILRTVIWSAVIFFSFLFGAMMHAYATNGEPASGAVNETNIQTVSHAVVPAEPAYQPYIVDRGDSLWTIAKQYLPAHMDIRDYIYEIKAMNQLDSAMIMEGQLLQIPIIQ